MTAHEERLRVIENIRTALEEKNTFKKVELFDPVITDEDVKRLIEPFDTGRRKLKSKILSFFARKIAEKETKKRNALTEVRGIENALAVNCGAIITQNHFGIMSAGIELIARSKVAAQYLTQIEDEFAFHKFIFFI